VNPFKRVVDTQVPNKKIFRLPFFISHLPLQPARAVSVKPDRFEKQLIISDEVFSDEKWKMRK
jgi:hypothetical protein